MKREWVIERIVYNKKANAIQYKTIKRFSDAEGALNYLNKNKNEAIQLSNTYSVNTVPILIATDKARKERSKIKD